MSAAGTRPGGAAPAGRGGALPNAVRAEWRKFGTAGAARHLSAAILLIAVARAVLTARIYAWGYADLVPGDATGLERLLDISPARFAEAATGIGGLLALVLGVLTVTGEYATGLIRATALALPDRRLAPAAKALVAGSVGAVALAAAVGAAVLAGHLALPGPLAAAVPLADAEVARLLPAAAVAGALLATLGVGLGLLLRRAGTAVPLALVWWWLVEPALPGLPRVGEALAPWRPFAALTAALGGDSPFRGVRLPWAEPAWGLAYFALWALALLAAGGWAWARRDVRPVAGD